MDIEQQEDLTPWYALRLYSVRHKAVSKWLEEQSIEFFVPMHYVDIELEGRVKHILRPVVSNLVFVKKSMTEKAFRQFVFNSPYKMSVITKSRENREFCEIPAREMQEFRMMCNPEVELRKYVSEQEAKLKALVDAEIVTMVTQGVTEERREAFLKELEENGSGEYCQVYQQIYDRWEE